MKFCYFFNFINILFSEVFRVKAVDGKRFLESNAFSIPGTYFRLGYVKVPRFEEALDSRNRLPLTALFPFVLLSDSLYRSNFGLSIYKVLGFNIYFIFFQV